MNKKSLIVQNNLMDQLDHYYAFNKHKDKLQKIKNRKSIDKGKTKKTKLLEMKNKAHDFHEKEKTNDIKKSNDILLEKLLNISQGKHSLLGSIQNTSPTFSLKSLNHKQKMREYERIDYENEKMIERILSQGSTISIKKMREDYRNRK